MISLPAPRIFPTARSSCSWTADTSAWLASSGDGKVVWPDAPARHGLTDTARSSAHATSTALACGLAKGRVSNSLFIPRIIANSSDRLEDIPGVIFIGDLLRLHHGPTHHAPPHQRTLRHGNRRRSSSGRARKIPL